MRIGFWSRLGACAVVGLVAMGCGGSKVPAESAATHEARAEHHEEVASAHEEAAERAGEQHHIEWSDAKRKEHLEQAERHRKIAAEHRARSEALRSAEQQACAGLEPDDRDEGPFVHKEDVVGVEPIVVKEGKQGVPRKRGVRVTFRAVPGMSTEWMERLIRCRLATAKAMNYENDWVQDDPLGVPNIRAQASSSTGGFAVEIEADDAKTTDEILRRVQAVTGMSVDKK